jgi:dTDP-4-dehydrorhamnose 3,5-epimerase
MKSQLFVEQTSIRGLFLIQRPTFKDNRGLFREVIRLTDIEEAVGVDFKFKQWNHSVSMPRVIRGLHCEDENKIVYLVTGSMFAAYVDLREDSDTFAKVVTIEFDDRDLKAVFIPKGVANSICVTGKKPLHYMYLVDDYYAKEKAKGVAWDDPDLKIDWPVKNPIISERDRHNPTMRMLFPGRFSNGKE